MAALAADTNPGVLSRDIGDYPEGILIPLDKPYRWTSADVVRKIKFAAKKHFGQKNLKVGHAGTLDPLATGVLVVCLGKATRLAETIQRSDKEYVAGITFGATTPSYDLEKPVDKLFPTDKVDEASLRQSLQSFVGEQEQIAPLFSAKSVDGVRAYEIARKLYRSSGGQALLDAEAEAPLSRQMIRISETELLSFKKTGTSCSNKAESTLSESPGNEPASASSRINVSDSSALGLPRAEVRIKCSKGTYIRAFARDLGESLDSGAHLHSLRRTACGEFRAEKALSIEEALDLFTKDSPHEV